MDPTTHPEAQTRTPGQWGRLAWLPITLLVAAIVVLKAMDWQTAYESQFLLMLFTLVFSTLSSLLVVVLVGRSFLERGTPGLLLFGCGVLLWGAAGTVAAALLPQGVNVAISVHNILICLSALCQLAGAFLSLKPRTALRAAGLPLALGYTGAVCVVWLVTVLVLKGRLPVFFVQGEGGTPLRLVVLGSATVMFAGAAALLLVVNRRAPTVFARWYGLALLLVATGLFGIMIESVLGSALSWTGRTAQFLSGAYMLVAALASVRESTAWTVTLSAALEHAREAVQTSEERYRMLFETMTEGFALHESEERFRTLADVIPQLCWMANADGWIFWYNQRWYEYTGTTPEQMEGWGWQSVHDPEVLSQVLERWKASISTGKPFDMVFPLRGSDGVFRPFLTRVMPVCDQAGNVVRWCGTNTDITERKQAEEALAENRERLSLALISSGMATFDWDIINNKRIWDDNVHTLLGTNPETFTGTTEEFFRVIHPEDRSTVQLALSRAIETTGEYEVEYRVVWPDGSIHHITARGKVHRDSSGRADRIRGICWDISEKKLAEEVLKKLNEELENRVAERTKDLATNLENLQFEIDERKKAEEYALRLNRLYAVLSETNQAIVRTKDRETLFNDFCRIAVEHGSFQLAWVGLVDEESGELKIVAANGATGYLDDIRITVNEEPAGIGPTGISVREGTYYICNDFLGDPITRPWHEKGRAHGIRASASIALKQEGQVIGALTLYADKKDFFDRQQVELLRQMGADVSFALDNIVRESRRQEAERALREETAERLRAMEALREKEQMLIQQSRQAAMGEMIGNIAHQWRQPLNTLGLTIQQLLLFYDLGEFTREFLDHNVSSSMELIQHMSRTIDDFRNYFRPDKEKVEFKVREAIVNTLSLLEGSLQNPRVTVDIVSKGDPAICGYRNEFAQVLLNILINARDVFIEREIDDPRVTITTRSEDGCTVITIADNAGGIPAEILGKIFDPYFTTKGPQQGTGVGLFMSKTIIEKNMGGRLSVRNIANGVEFKIEVRNGIHV